MNKIHTTVGVYPNLSYKMNGVTPENLEGHINYNKEWRLERALFVDGKCVYKGIFSDDKLKVAQKIVDSSEPIKTNTQPYQ